MAGLARRGERNAYIWPGFVDALATLLMVMMFLLLVFVMAHVFLGQALSGRDQALDKLRTQVGELAELLSLERGANKNLRDNLAQLSQELQVSVSLRDDLKTTVSELRARAMAAEDKISTLESVARDMERDLTTARDRVSTLEDEKQARQQVISEAEKKIQAQLAEMSGLNSDIAALQALKKELETKIVEMAELIAANEKTIADKSASLEKTSEELAQSAADLLRARQELESKSQALAKTTEELEKKSDSLDKSEKTLLEEKELSKSARAQVALLNQQTAALREQLAKIQAALEASEELAKKRNVMITALGNRLNAALASKVQELSRYRSEFFGRLRKLLGARRDVRVVGDRFVFQSEVLFAKGSAELGGAGKTQLDKLATTLLEIAVEIPGEIDWVLRVDGHTDNDPISTARYPSNWELSTARAISVVKHLVEAGLPARRLVAAGFGEFHPLDSTRDDEIGKRRNRRIELKLTQR